MGGLDSAGLEDSDRLVDTGVPPVTASFLSGDSERERCRNAAAGDNTGDKDLERRCGVSAVSAGDGARDWATTATEDLADDDELRRRRLLDFTLDLSLSLSVEDDDEDDEDEELDDDEDLELCSSSLSELLSSSLELFSSSELSTAELSPDPSESFSFFFVFLLSSLRMSSSLSLSL